MHLELKKYIPKAPRVARMASIQAGNETKQRPHLSVRLLPYTIVFISPKIHLRTLRESNNERRQQHSMIKGILIINNHGKPRLVKFYQSVESEALQQTVIRRVYQQVCQRPDSFCNYLEGIVPEWGDHIKLIYRHYATLYFVFAVDSQESDLGILDLIQVFVER